MSQANNVHTTRRTFLAGAAAVSAPLPALAAVAPVTPLARLVGEWRTADAAEQAACERYELATEHFQKIAPKLPEDLIFTVRERDLRLCTSLSIGEEIQERRIREWREFPVMRPVARPARPADNLPDDAHTVVRLQPWPEAQARVDEIVRAYDEHQAAIAAAKELSGFETASNAYDVAIDHETQIRIRIIKEPATCLSDLLLKAEVAVHCAGGMIEVDRDIDHDLKNERAYDTTLALSVLKDMARLGQWCRLTPVMSTVISGVR